MHSRHGHLVTQAILNVSNTVALRRPWGRIRAAATVQVMFITSPWVCSLLLGSWGGEGHVAVETSSLCGEGTTFPSDSGACGRVRRGGQVHQARCAPGSAPRRAGRPPRPPPGDEVGGARSHLATAWRPMRRSFTAPATEAPARHNAALRQRRLRQRRGLGRGGREPEPGAGARAAERRHHAGSGGRVLLAALHLGDLPPGALRSGR